MRQTAGKIMPLPRGAYDEKTEYGILDIVTYDNKLWICKKSGTTGVTPTKTAAEWMMCVDGTTDVSALETELQEKIDSYDTRLTEISTNIDSVNSQIEATNESVTTLTSTVDDVAGKVVFDTKPTKDSSKLVSSGTVYNMFHYDEGASPRDDGTYENNTASATVAGYAPWIEHRLEQKFTSGSGLVHRKATSNFNLQGFSANINSRTEKLDGDTESNETACGISLSSGNISMDFSNDYSNSYNRSMVLWFTCDSFRPQDKDKYDLGTSSDRFKDIYAQCASVMTSDRNEKKDIEELADASDFIMGLKPVTYKFINGASGRTHYGLIAQDVEELLSELGMTSTDFAGFVKTQRRDENNEPIEGEYTYGLRYGEFIAPLISMCQNLQTEVQNLKMELEALKKG